MKTLTILLLCMPILSTATAVRAGQPHIARERIEWCDIWITDAAEATLPRVLLIGDSITRGYYGQVATKLAGKAAVSRLATSKSLGDPVFLQEVALVLGQCSFDVIHFNNGLHGWGYSEQEYQAQFPALLATIRKHAPRAKLIWATTTPKRMRERLDAIDPATERVKARNAIAQQCIAGQGIAVDDLYDLVKDHPEYYSHDGTHFNAKGIAAQADQVAGKILESLR